MVDEKKNTEFNFDQKLAEVETIEKELKKSHEEIRQTFSKDIGENTKPEQKINQACNAAYSLLGQLKNEIVEIKPIHENVRVIQERVLTPVLEKIVEQTNNSILKVEDESNKGARITRFWAVVAIFLSVIVSLFIEKSSGFWKRLFLASYCPTILYEVYTNEPRKQIIPALNEITRNNFNQKFNGEPHEVCELLAYASQTITINEYSILIVGSNCLILDVIAFPESDFSIASDYLHGLPPRFYNEKAINERYYGYKLFTHGPFFPDKEYSKDTRIRLMKGDGRGDMLSLVNLKNKKTVKFRLLVKLEVEATNLGLYGKIFRSAEFQLVADFDAVTTQAGLASGSFKML